MNNSLSVVHPELICSRIGFCHDIRWTVDWTELVYEGCDCSR